MLYVKKIGSDLAGVKEDGWRVREMNRYVVDIRAKSGR